MFIWIFVAFEKGSEIAVNAPHIAGGLHGKNRAGNEQETRLKLFRKGNPLMF